MKTEKLLDNLYKYSEFVKVMDFVVYLLKGDKNILIDAGVKIKEKVDLVLLTHCHVDHIKFAEYYQKKGAKIYICSEDSKSMEILDDIAQPLDSIRVWGKADCKCKADKLLEGGEIIKNSNFTLKVINSPGHTKGGIALYEESKKILFSGDTWFGGDVIGTIAYGGNHEDEIRSVKKLKSLKVDLLCPGH